MIYILYGEDNFLKEEAVKKIKKSFGELKAGINYIQIDESNVSNLISDIETPAFGYDKKLITVKNTGLFKKKDSTSDKIAEFIQNNNNDYIELIFIEENVEKNKLYNVINKIGKIVEFKEQKMPQLIKKVKSISNAYGVEIKENTAQYFIECVGTNMQTIINELRKLIEYAGKGGEIKKEDIDALSIKKSETIIFDLTDALGKKQIKSAIEILHNLEYEREPVQKILIMLYNHFKKLYIIHLCKGKDVAQNLKLKPNQIFLVNKYSMQAKCFKENELSKIIDELILLDENSKNGNIDLEIGLESILCRYCS